MSLRKSQNEVFDIYNTKITYYPNGQEVAYYSKPILKRNSGFEEVKAEKAKSAISEDLDKTDIKLPKKEEKASYMVKKGNRAKAEVISYVRCNRDAFTSFITLTIRENISDVSQAYKLLYTWLKKIQRNYPNFKYIGVPEHQERGAIHYHLLTNLTLHNGYEFQEGKKDMYDVDYWEHGYTSVFPLDPNHIDENFSVDKYITKYFTKGFRLACDEGHKRYYHSRNLNKPKKEYILQTEEEQEKSYQEYLSKHKQEILEKKEKTVFTTNKYCPKIKYTNIILKCNTVVKKNDDCIHIDKSNSSV